MEVTARCVILSVAVCCISAFTPPAIARPRLASFPTHLGGASSRRPQGVYMVAQPPAAAAGLLPDASNIASMIQKGDVAALQAAVAGHETQVAAIAAGSIFLLGALMSSAAGPKPGNPYGTGNQYDQRCPPSPTPLSAQAACQDVTPTLRNASCCSESRH